MQIILQLYANKSAKLQYRRGRGVCYREVLCDVCDKMKVNYNKYSSTKQIEQNLLMKILEDVLERMSPEELKIFANEFGLENINELTPQALASTFITIFRMGGFKSYRILVTVVNAILKALIGRGLTIGGNALLTKTASILVGPIGWIITALWTLIDIAGAAYRVTIPAVIQIAYLRILMENKKMIEAEEAKLNHLEKVPAPKNACVIGVGGAGNNIIQFLNEQNRLNVDYCVVNTEISSNAQNQDYPYHLLTDPSQENVKGNPDLAEKLAWNEKERLLNIVANSNPVFLVAGLGGCTGSGISPVIAEIAKEQGKEVIAFVTMPFPFEGHKRKTYADQGLEKLNSLCDKVFVFDNYNSVKNSSSLIAGFSSIGADIQQKIREYLA